MTTRTTWLIRACRYAILFAPFRILTWRLDGDQPLENGVSLVDVIDFLSAVVAYWLLFTVLSCLAGAALGPKWESGD